MPPLKFRTVGFPNTASSVDLNVTFTLVEQIKSSPDILCSLLAYTHPQAIVRLSVLLVPFQAFTNWNYLSLQITPTPRDPSL